MTAGPPEETAGQVPARESGLCTTINSLKLKLVYAVFKNSVRTAKKTQHFTITKINWLTLFKEIIGVYYQKRGKPINTVRG
jgi:hypothetical protein